MCGMQIPATQEGKGGEVGGPSVSAREDPKPCLLDWGRLVFVDIHEAGLFPGVRSRLRPGPSVPQFPSSPGPQTVAFWHLFPKRTSAS